MSDRQSSGYMELEKRMFLSLVVASLLLMSTSLVSAQVHIDHVVVPSSLAENSWLNVSFGASTDSNSTIYYKIYINNVMVSDTNSYAEFMDYGAAGTYLLSLVAFDSASTSSENHSIQVNNIPMVLTLNNLSSDIHNSRTIGVDLTSSIQADSCTYVINNSDSGQLVGSNTSFHKDISFSDDGAYLLNVTCINSHDISSVSSSFIIDTVAPVILSKSVNVDTNNVANITVSTGTSCICRYDTVDRSYDSMSYTFSITNNVQHYSAISGLGDGSYTYYIRCRDTADNNVMLTSEVVTFSIAIPPSAAISLSGSSPLKTGTYEVWLTTNENVQNNPVLYYTLDNDQTARYVSLTGSGTDWKGYLIIDDSLGGRVGTFHYSGKDYHNNIGSIITQNELFLIDTVKPIAPTSSEAVVRDDGSIQLKWYYDGKEVDRYNIYRSVTSDVDYVDYYDTSNSKQYVDNTVIDGVTYYYRIAAVDKAGNDGELSSIISGTSTRRYVTNNDVTSSANDASAGTPVEMALDSQLIPKVDQQILELQKFLVDVDTAKTELGKINDVSKLKVITALGLNGKIAEATNTINDIITQTGDLKNNNLKASELDVRLNKLRLDAIKAKTNVVEDIIIDEESDYAQITQDSDVDQAITSVTENYNLSRKAMDNYTLANKQLQDSITVNSEVIIFRIKYVGRDDYDKYTLVKKTVKANPELDNVIILENIPKDFEKKASDISFNIGEQQNPAVVKEDPVVRWDADTLSSQTIYYMVNANVDMSSAKNTRTIVLKKPDFKFSDGAASVEKNNGLTGFISFDTLDISRISLIQWCIFLGVGLVICLSAYYVTLDGREKKKNTQKLKDHRIITSRPSPGVVQVRAALKPSMNKATIYFDINTKLEEANALINGFNYEKSRTIYNLCMGKLDAATITVAQKREARQMLDHLFLKLSAYRLIYQSRKHLASKNYALVKDDIDDINVVYTKLVTTLSVVDDDHKEVERKFIDYIVNSKRHLESVTS